MLRGTRLWLLLGVVLVCPVHSGASGKTASVAGVAYPERCRAGEHELALRGLGAFRWKWLLTAYTAGLYLPEGVALEKALDDVPKRLELSYFYSISGEDFGPAADAVLARSLSEAELGALRERLDRLHALYQDVAAGDRYALTYVPGRGTELSLNGSARGVIPGADFAQAYFGIWLGRAPLDAALRDQLLGGRD